MELDTNFKEDFPFLSENSSNSPFKPGFGNGLFPFADQGSSSSTKGLLHNFILSDQNQNQHSILDVNNAPLLDPQDFHQIPVDGSTKNPFLGVSSTCNDGLEPYNTTVFPTDLNYAYIPTLPFAADASSATNDHLFQGFQPQGSYWDFSQNNSETDQTFLDQNDVFHQDKVDDEYENQRFFQTTRSAAGIKALNKIDIIKGQWTLQEDRYNKILFIFYNWCFA